jgi:hypothetical protein
VKSKYKKRYFLKVCLTDSRFARQMAAKRFFSFSIHGCSRLKPVSLLLFAGILLSLFTLQSLVAEGSPVQKCTNSFSQALTFSYQFPTLQLPAQSSATPCEREIPNDPDDNEQEDDLDNDLNVTAEQATLFSIFDFITIKNWFTYSTGCMQNHSPVPLFVIQHSWKSFVC